MSIKLTPKEAEDYIISYQAMKTVEVINLFFAENPDDVLSEKDFMNLQKEVWEEVKKKFKIKIEDEKVFFGDR